ncbi:MAG: hypothetical protein WEF50_15360 [Myxococcota bacterium]
MAELRRDVAELHAGGEELARERVAQILHVPVADLGGLQDPPPFGAAEHARIKIREHVGLEGRSELRLVKLEQCAAQTLGQSDAPATPTLRRAGGTAARATFFDQ